MALLLLLDPPFEISQQSKQKTKFPHVSKVEPVSQCCSPQYDVEGRKQQAAQSRSPFELASIQVPSRLSWLLTIPSFLLTSSRAKQYADHSWGYEEAIKLGTIATAGFKLL